MKTSAPNQNTQISKNLHQAFGELAVAYATLYEEATDSARDSLKSRCEALASGTVTETSDATTAPGPTKRTLKFSPIFTHRYFDLVDDVSLLGLEDFMITQLDLIRAPIEALKQLNNMAVNFDEPILFYLVFNAELGLSDLAAIISAYQETTGNNGDAGFFKIITDATAKARTSLEPLSTDLAEIQSKFSNKDILHALDTALSELEKMKTALQIFYELTFQQK